MPAALYTGYAPHKSDSFYLLDVEGGVHELSSRPVAYIKEAARHDARRAVDIARAVDREGEWLRLEYEPRRRWDMRDALQRVQSYEADVGAMRRYLSETEDLTFATNETRDLYFDIETDDRQPIDEQLAGRARVISIAWAEGMSGRVHFICLNEWSDAAEREMIEAFLRVMQRTHLYIAWGLSNFDGVVLKARGVRLGISFPWWRYQALDMLDVFRKHFVRGETGEQRQSFKLDAMGKGILGRAKLNLREMVHDDGEGTPPAIGHGLIRYAWQKNPEALAVYNRTDVSLMQGLEERKHFIALQKTLASLCHTLPGGRSLHATELADGVFLRLGRRRGVHFPTKVEPTEEMLAHKARGATVGEVIVGVHDDVHMFDYGGLYPNIMLAWNISPETCIGNENDTDPPARPQPTIPAHRAENGAWFRYDRRGVFPEVIEAGIARRNVAKARAQQATDATEQVDLSNISDGYKVFNNSLYGITLSPWSRYYSRHVGEAVTLGGRMLLGVMCEVVESHDGTVVLSDTDGAAGVGADPATTTVDINRRVCERTAGLSGTGALIAEHETTFERLVIFKKKRYAGIARFYKGATLDQAKIEVKGLEMMRSDGCRYMRELQKEIVYGFLRDGEDATVMQRKLYAARERVIGMQLTSEDLVLSKALQKEIDEYKAEAPHVQVARELRDAGQAVNVGEKIPYIVIGREGGRQRAVHVDDYDGEYDARLYWNDLIYPALRRVVEVMFPSADWGALVVKGNVNQSQFRFQVPVEPQQLHTARRRVIRARPREQLRIRLLDGTTRNDVEWLREVLATRPGSVPVLVSVLTPGRIQMWVDVQIADAWRCDAEAVQAEIAGRACIDCEVVRPVD